MKNIDRIIILYPGETSSDAVSRPANFALSRLLLALHARGDIPVHILNQSAGHEQWGNVEFAHLTLAGFLKWLVRSRRWRNTLIISQTGAYRHYAMLLRAALPGSRVLVRLGGVYHGRRYLESHEFQVRRHTLRRRLAFADMIVCTADGTPVDLYMQKLGIKPQRYRKWLNGFPVIPKQGEHTRGNRIVCISRLHPVKGIDYVLRSFALARRKLSSPHTLLIVGDGPDRSKLEKLARALGIGGHVEFIGYSADVGAHLRSSKLLVTGLANNPVIEAIATGTPVITLDLGEMRTLYGKCPNVHVVAYPPGGYGPIPAEHLETVVRDTADRIVAVLNDYPRLDDVDAAATYGLQTWEQRIQNELDLYEELLAPTPGG